MKAKIVLTARVKTGLGYNFAPVQIENGFPVAPPGAMTFYLRYSQNGRRRVRPVGPSLSHAFMQYLQEQLNHTRRQVGLAAVEDSQPIPGRVRIADAVAKYLDDLDGAVSTRAKSIATVVGYKKAVEDFRDHCGVVFLDEITGEVLKKHRLYLFENMPKRARGKKSNTVAKRFRYLNTFFNKQGIAMKRDRRQPGTGLVDWSEIPREEKPKAVDEISLKDIKTMLSVCDDDQADLIHFFVKTGCRKGEVANLEWQDIDFNRQQITICEKPGWRPKDQERRTIPFEEALLKRLQARKKRQLNKSKFVFPNSSGTPDVHIETHLFHIIEKVKRAGLEMDGVPLLHRFRKTFASMMLPCSDLQTVSTLLGHSDMDTTARYLVPHETKARIRAQTAFKAIDD